MFAGDHILRLVIAPAKSGVQPLLLALSIVYAIIASVSLGLIVRRARRPGFWLIRRQQTTFGTYLLPHTLNVSLLCVLVFALVAQGAGACLAWYRDRPKQSGRCSASL